MPYTIAPLDGTPVARLCKTIQTAIDRDGRFEATLTILGKVPGRPYKDGIAIKPVRLRQTKLYCGQHPGECLIGPTKRSRFLDWEDWVAFHDLINRILDRTKVSADAWSNPAESIDSGKKMWIRRGLSGRIRWDWHDDPNDRFGGVFRNVNRIWNHGSADQFRMDEQVAA